jgi:hypothetical protein
MRKAVIASVLMGATAFGSAGVASAETALALKAGTLGVGAELAIGLTEKLNLRLGYSFFDYSTTLEDTDVTYDAELQLRNPSAVLAWHPFSGGFHFSLGAVGASTKVVGTGVPNGTQYVINGNSYNASQIGKVDATIEASNSVAPYVGIGWGNPVDAKGRWTLMLDLGAIYYGSKPDVVAVATCGATLPSQLCTRLQTDIAAERQQLIDEVDTLTWYPVLNLGLAFKF